MTTPQQQQPPAVPVQPPQQGAAGSAGQGAFSTVLGSFVAVITYVTGALAAIPDHVATCVDGGASRPDRARAFTLLAGKLALLGLLVFAAWQEWQQHIIYTPETAKQQAISTAAEAAQKKMVTDALIEEATRPHCDAKVSVVAQMTPGEFQSMTAQQKKAIDAFCDTNPTQQQILVWLEKTFPEHRSLCGAGQVYSRGACGPVAP